MRRTLFLMAVFIAIFLCSCTGVQSDGKTAENISAGSVITVEGTESFANQEAARAAAKKNSSASGKQEDLTKCHIGVTFAGADASYLIMLADDLKKDVTSKNADLDIQYAGWDAQTQTQQVEKFIEEKKDAIILCPVDAKSLLTALKEAQQAEIPVINLNMKVDDISSEYISTYVGASSTEEAVLAAQMADEILGEAGGQVGIIEGTPGTDPQIYRTQGFFNTIASKPQIKVVEIGEGYWLKDKAYTQALTMMIRNPKLSLIYAQDSDMAMGAVQAIEEKNMSRQIKVIGIGEGDQYSKAVSDGRLYGFVYQDAAYEARQSLECALLAADGKTLQPWYRNSVRIITRANVDQLN